MLKLIGKKLARLVFYSIGFGLYYTGITQMYLKRKLKNKFLVVFYHEVSDSVDLLGSIATKPRYFENQIRFLAKYFTLVSTDEINSISSNNEISGYPVLLTFDGGYKGNILYAYPILKKYNAPGLIYIVTDNIEHGGVPWTTKLFYILNNTEEKYLDYDFEDSLIYKGKISDRKKALKSIKKAIYHYKPVQRYRIISELAARLGVKLNKLNNAFMNWDDVTFLHKDEKITIGSHTITHPRLTEISQEEVKKEISLSKKQIEDRIGDEIISFCYPDGKIDEDTVRIVRESGYRYATTTTNGVNSNQTDPLLLKRVGGGNMPPFVFALKISGLFRKLNV